VPLFDCFTMSEQAALPHNEDCVLAEPGYGVFAVADGMGGRPGGAQASRLAVRAFMDYLRRVNPAQISNPVALRNAVAMANTAIRAVVEADPKMHGMGTTLTAAVLTEGGGRIVHVGDSRAYLFAGGQLEQLTQDHTLASELVDRKMLAEEAVDSFSLRHVLSRAIGTRSSVEPEIVDFHLTQYDWLLLVTDGFYKALGPEEMAGLILFSAGDNAQSLCRTLMRTALNADPQDNVTLAVIRRLGGK
jgi:serine/threonine protein phosphatase PrpC